MRYKAFVLSKNEAPNIDRCIDSLTSLGLAVKVLDSGSADGTLEIVMESEAQPVSYQYTDHCRAYNHITRAESDDVGCLVIDADMRVSSELWQEARTQLEAGVDVVSAPVAFFLDGVRLKHASLYPPKPFLFRGGADYFRPSGHGEVLKDGVVVQEVEANLVHDDRKPFQRRLQTQQKYARQLAKRVAAGEVPLKDWVRFYTPVTTMLIAPYILLGRLGLLDGWIGVQYAVERLITEALIWREGTRSLAGSLVKSDVVTNPTSSDSFGD